MARVVSGSKRASVDPLKLSQPLGGALVFLGLARSMPVMHGSQGCASFAKALLTRHFREPIPLQTTAVTEVTAVLGARDVMYAALDAVRGKQRPEIIGLLTTGLTEVSGEDVLAELESYLRAATDRANDPVNDPTARGADVPLLVGVSTPDFRGGLSDGYAAALEALVRAVPLDPPRSARGVAILVGPAVTVADLDEIRALTTSFGLDPVVVPDLSGSLDGHLAEEWSSVTTGGTTRAALGRLGDCGAIVAIGASVAKAASALAERTGAELTQLPHTSGLGAADTLVQRLAEWSGALVGPQVRQWRSRLADGLLDAHFALGGARVAVALEPDQLHGVVSLLHDVGADVVTAVSPSGARVLTQVPCDEVVIGDLNDLEERARQAHAELVIGSSHARAVSRRVGAAHLELGYPVYDRLGVQLRGSSGYQGSLRLLVDAANRLFDHHEDRSHRHLSPSDASETEPLRHSPIEESLC